MKWIIDPSHSSVEFKVRHMAISTVKGAFNTFSGTAQTENGVIQSVTAEIDTASIHTNDEKRDGHLRSGDFFDAETYPKITFQSTHVERNGDEYRITGDLTMHGQTHPATFTAEVSEPITDPYGLTRSGANVQGKLNRTEWGLQWNQVLEAGGLMVGEDIRFEFDLEATVQQPQMA